MSVAILIKPLRMFSLSPVPSREFSSKFNQFCNPALLVGKWGWLAWVVHSAVLSENVNEAGSRGLDGTGKEICCGAHR